MNEIFYPSQLNVNNVYIKTFSSRDAGKDNSSHVDHNLVRRAKSGDRRAFDRLVIKYQDKLKHVVSRYLKLPQQIEDVMQETFINAYSGIMSFREDSKFSTWLHRIGINAALGYLAAESRRIPHYQPALNVDTNEPIVSEIVDEENPEKLVARSQVSKTVSKAIKELPIELGQAITFRDINELSYEEIANIMGCPIGTVRSRIFRARDCLAIKLQPQVNPASKNYI